ncbi:hypothetical protein B0H16DRAFT_1897323 [Mycena metata]|uniref:Uncharacterized protein n=1 Tax=Mycena metata TaxID=1033252 RepID=A0AAD7HFA9_9AGAR|nr:hypothetical protein B0H16DRAFT_1897323 [Mycena metata]
MPATFTLLSTPHVLEIPVPAATYIELSANTITYDSEGPTCSHCGWKGGNHAPNCPFIPIPSVNLNALDLLSLSSDPSDVLLYHII